MVFFYLNVLEFSSHFSSKGAAGWGLGNQFSLLRGDLKTFREIRIGQLLQAETYFFSMTILALKEILVACLWLNFNPSSDIHSKLI
jgi:hypothetical protein